jgi:type IV pilus assembly protein PilV
MTSYKNISSVNDQQGVVLLEALIGILIFSLGIIGLVGLQAAMLKSTSAAQYRSEAGYIAQQQLGLMWADPCNLAAYSTGAPTPIASLPNGTLMITHQYSGNEPNDACPGGHQLIDQTTVTVTWQLPGEPLPHRVVTSTSITGG